MFSDAKFFDALLVDDVIPVKADIIINEASEVIPFNAIAGKSTNDFLMGTEKPDFILALEGDDVARGGIGADLIYGGIGNDSIFGGRGADTLYGNQGSDVLVGALGNDELYGNRGADRLEGGAGSNTLTGGNGADIFVLSVDGTQVIADFGNGGLDKIASCAIAFEDLAIAQEGADVLVSVGDKLLAIVEGATVATVGVASSFVA